MSSVFAAARADDRRRQSAPSRATNASAQQRQMNRFTAILLPSFARARKLVAVPNPAVADLLRDDHRVHDRSAERVGGRIEDRAELLFVTLWLGGVVARPKIVSPSPMP